ncbi:hypothetical protein [Lyngbya aestuarii]|uniref:hypothetical protein n=1 Tax=Lyngbya aestuarii TaxID=118322 RepID=UPI00403D686E
MGLFLAIHRHYQALAAQLSVEGPVRLRCAYRPSLTEVTHPALVLVGQIHRGTLEALEYACTIADEIVAVHVDIGTTDRVTLQQKWEEFADNIPLVILDSPYRSIVTPLTEFVSEFEGRHPSMFSTVILPVFVPRNWWEELLHNQTTLFLRAALRVKHSRVVTTVRYYL